MATAGYDIPSPSHAAVTVEPDSDDEDLVAISNTQLNQPSQKSSNEAKGKTRAGPSAPEILSPRPPPPGPPPGVSGNIGDSGRSGGASSKPQRQTIRGIVTESRYGQGMNTLDEPISETIVSRLSTLFFEDFSPCGSANAVSTGL